MSVLEKINDLAAESKLLNEVSRTFFLRKPWGDLSSTTVVMGNLDCKLREAVACPIEESFSTSRNLPLPVGFKGVVAIHRMCFSVGAISRASGSLSSLESSISLVLQGGIEDLQNQLGNLFGYRLTTQRPDCTYFKLMEDVNGYELLLYAIKE
jgi:hypothetical protein